MHLSQVEDPFVSCPHNPYHIFSSISSHGVMILAGPWPPPSKPTWPSLHSTTPRLQRSLSTSSSQQSHDLILFLLSPGCPSIIILGDLLRSILSTWSSHLILSFFMVDVISGASYIFFNSSSTKNFLLLLVHIFCKGFFFPKCSTASFQRECPELASIFNNWL